MKLVKEYIINEKFVKDSDPIEDMSIGAMHRFKNFLKLLGEEDKQQLIYTVYFIFDFVDLYFNAPTLRKLHESDANNAFNEVKNMITKLGFDSIMTDPKLFMRYDSNNFKNMPCIVRFKLYHKAVGIITPANYRRLRPDEFVIYRNAASTREEYEKHTNSL